MSIEWKESSSILFGVCFSPKGQLIWIPIKEQHKCYATITEQSISFVLHTFMENKQKLMFGINCKCKDGNKNAMWVLTVGGLCKIVVWSRANRLMWKRETKRGGDGELDERCDTH